MFGHPIRRPAILAVACGLALASFGSFAAAQPGDDAPLRGPRVVDREGPAGRFGPGENANRQRAQQQGESVQDYLRMVRVLGSERVPEEVRLTDAQQDVIRPLAEAHAKELGAYYTKHKDTLVKAATLLGATEMAERIAAAESIDAQAVQAMGERLRETMRTRAAARRGGDAMEPREGEPQRAEWSPEQREAMQLLGELRRGAPAGETALAGIKAALTDEQREFIDARARQVRERAQAREGEAGDRVQPRMPGRVFDDQQMDDQAMGGERPRGRAASPVKSDRLGKLLEGMTAEEQERLAEMLERRREAGAGRGEGRGEGRGSRRPDA